MIAYINSVYTISTISDNGLILFFCNILSLLAKTVIVLIKSYFKTTLCVGLQLLRGFTLVCGRIIQGKVGETGYG